METAPNEAWKRIEAVMEAAGETAVNAFAKRIGMSRPERLFRIKRGMNGISKALACSIHTYFPQFDEEWLMKGGDNSASYIHLKINNRFAAIPFYDDFATLCGNRHMFLPDVLTNGAEIAVKVRKASWCTYPHTGAVLLFKKNVGKFENGIIYLLCLESGNVICRINCCENTDYLSVTPEDNGKPRKIAAEKVIEVYRLCGTFVA